MNELKSTLSRLKFLPALFRKVDVEKISPHAAVFLTRAMQKGLVYRLIRGNYVNSFLHGFPRVEEVACFLSPPAYVTCEWARMNWNSRPSIRAVFRKWLKNTLPP